MDISKLNKDELEALQIVKETERQLAEDNLSQVELRDCELSRKATEIRLERQNLSPALIQGKHNIRRIISELKVIQIRIWQELKK